VYPAATVSADDLRMRHAAGPAQNDTPHYPIQFSQINRIQELTLNSRVRGSSPCRRTVLTWGLSLQVLFMCPFCPRAGSVLAGEIRPGRRKWPQLIRLAAHRGTGGRTMAAGQGDSNAPDSRITTRTGVASLLGQGRPALPLNLVTNWAKAATSRSSQSVSRSARRSRTALAATSRCCLPAAVRVST
jgi:hypothetical protein